MSREHCNNVLGGDRYDQVCQYISAQVYYSTYGHKDELSIMLVHDIMETINLIQLIYGIDPETYRFKEFRALYENNLNKYVKLKKYRFHVNYCR